MSPAVRITNWDIIAEELDKIGIGIDDDVLDEIRNAKQAPIDKMFSRIERFSTIIAGHDFLKFETVKAEDLDEELDDDFMER